MGCRVILLTGPSGSGKSHLARASGLPVLALDHFYRSAGDPDLPMRAELGIVDWDDPRSWDADAAFVAIAGLCATGSAEVPVYSISQSAVVGLETVTAGGTTYVAEGLFAAELVTRCRDAAILADAVTIRRSPWKNFLRRLARDLKEHRKPPWTLLRRGRLLMREERAIVAHHEALGCRSCSASETRRLLQS